jgi:sn-glycerol 3-phosphate transport system ATP-binding protein
MNKGQIEQVGTPDDVYHRPASTYVAGFVGSPGLNLLSVIIDRAAEQIRFKDGQAIALDSSHWPHLPEGPVTLGFRAEQAAIVFEGGLAISPHFSEALGSSRLLHGTVGAEQAVISIGGTQHHAEDTPLQVGIAPNAMHFFDAVNGRRILASS